MQTYKKELKPYFYLGIFLFVIGFGIGNFFWLLPGTDYFSKTNYLFTKDILTCQGPHKNVGLWPLKM